ncbi:DUF4192 domain-containing protein [Streptomyces sp. V1I1]|uniref:DUF4192 domain-containing protein n=1 Tax=Streptomyces sp. V1I1 TaxID=3042272 RepID=UPI00278B3F1A|nr:DUF4192 domain-containing protein [Streptomyces sp. V1I1]MDQ0940238.1 hypothetical protein [Streptomyces sp. V1I1]
MNKHHEPTGPADEQQITLRGPAELADALPYMMGFHPSDSIVLVALHGSRGRFGGRLRLGIPRSPREWSPVAQQLAECLIEGSERRGSRPDGIVVFLCQDPAEGETSHRVMERLRPLAQRLRTACGTFDVPVFEALCISDGRFWSYCCPDSRCCPPEGDVLALPGTSVMAAAAAYAGIQVRGTLRQMEARLEPMATASAADQEKALDAAGAALVPRILDGEGRQQVAAETLALARRLMKRIAETPRSGGWAETDVADDRLITHDEAAAVVLGLQDRDTRDRAAEWMEGPDADPALRLWRALSRRCVGPYSEHAAAPLTLAGWVAWSTGDEPGARVALGRALRVDPEYVFARLLHQACNEGLDPEALRSCLRKEHGSGVSAAARGAGGHPHRPRSQQVRPPAGKKGQPPAGTRPEKSVSRNRSRGSRRSGQRGTRSGR